MRCVGDETPFPFARAFEAREHGVQRSGQLADLVDGGRLRKPSPRVAGALDLRRGGREPAERPQRAAHEEGDNARAERSRDDACKEHEEVQARKRLFQVVPRGSDDHRAAGGRPAEPGERCRVDSDAFPAEFRVRIAGSAAADGAPGSRVRGQDATAE